MNDMEFDAFLESVIKENGREYIDYNEEWDKPHVFSHSFERKMRRIIGKQERYGFYPTTRLPLRKALVLAVLVIIMMTVLMVTVSAFRDAIFGFFMSVFDTHTRFTVETNDDTPNSIINIYEPTILPKGFEIQTRDELPYKVVTEYDYGELFIVIQQYIKAGYSPDVNTEQANPKPIMINNYKGFIIEIPNHCHITWETDEYVFSVGSNVSKDELIEIVESIK